MLDVRDAPMAADVERLESALRALERRFTHGPGGLLTCLGWGVAWFERHTALPSVRRVGRRIHLRLKSSAEGATVHFTRC
jgi:hypothetical protein